ncbi:SRPBCC family protein [Larkinella soli]|uniref:SRPBCC family protein n=1 Tax=Larkinella soli TaxID=1770527 RepID=UPI000FFB5303|nr:SRPBCC family protein [Larkinella soli]
MTDKKKPVSQVLGIGQIEPEVSGSSRLNVGSTERIWSAAGGAFLLTFGLRQGSLLTALAGGYLAYRGASGHCPISERIGRNTAEAENQVPDAIEISKSLTINRPREEVYKYWRQLENLPRFMFHLKEVTQIDPRRSHWVAKLADTKLASVLGKVEWEARIIEEVENERLVWKSVEGARIDNAGEVRFVDSPDGEGTEIHAVIHYRPPVGQLGGAIMKLFNPTFKQMIKQDLRRFKQLMETGEIATIKGQTSGRLKENQPLDKPSSEYASTDEKHEGLML